MLSWLQHRWTALYLLFMGLGAFMLYLYGFFPIKYHTGEMAHWNELPTSIDGITVDGQTIYSPEETSVVLMIIDGLRYDFVTDEYMPYTGQLLKDKTACIYVSVAEPPTVTMPRIKSPERRKERAQWRRTINFWRDIFAMMTGSVSTFADVALNFGAPAVHGDSVLRVAAARGRRSVLYGDDTWLRLFPGLWAEYDGTTSFYVTDYTEVDNNVTRHLDTILAPNEKNKPSFDFLVLHYLGLDHIGHLEGARSPMIKPKLVEMDEIVKKIFTAMKKWDRRGVLLLCGDHGMRDAGGHGGATPAELLVPLVLVRSDDFTCPHPNGPGPTVAQVDVAPSVSWLLGAPLPGDSTGRLLPALLPEDTGQQLYVLHYTADHNAKAVRKQLGEVAVEKEFYKQFQRATKQYAQFLSSGQLSAAKLAKQFYEESLDEMSKYLTESTVDFDMFAIGVAITLLYSIGIATMCVMLYSFQYDPKKKYSVAYHGRNRSQAGAIVAFFIVLTCSAFILTLACAITETKSNMCSLTSPWILVFIAVSIGFTVTFFVIKTALEQMMDLSLLKGLNSIDMLLILGTLFHSWSFFGTSFIEEEHLTWYFFWNTLMFFILLRTLLVVVTYVSKGLAGATEVQDKPLLRQKMKDGVKMLPKWICLIALHRYLRTMNQTGDRWAFLPDTADWLNSPENIIYLQAHLVIGTLMTFAICLWNLRYTNNLFQMNSALTFVAYMCILLYRISTNSLYTPIESMKNWDPVLIINVFWGLLTSQVIFELLTYLGAFRRCNERITGQVSNPDYVPLNDKAFMYKKTKEKTEDFVFDEVEEPWNSDEVKLNLVRSISHIALNDMMMIIILLMRPHNVIMVPSIYMTSHLTMKSVEHGLFNVTKKEKHEILDTMSRTIANIWIGCLFFFYQGNSNSLATVDLGAGYVGLRQYCPWRVAARMGLHAYAAPALAGIALFAHVAARATNFEGYLKEVWLSTNILATHRAYSVSIYAIVTSVFRHHLFVWTVFSPKLLYDFVAIVFSVTALVTMAEIIGITHATSWVAKVLTRKTGL